MDYEIKNLFKLNQLSTGRRIFALRLVRVEAVRRGDTEIVTRTDVALAHDQTTRRLDLEWSGQRLLGSNDPIVQQIDNLLDRALTGLRDVATGLTSGARPDDPIHGQVKLLLDTIYPAGVFAITSLRFVEQLTAVETIVELLQGELAPLVAELGLHTSVQRIVELSAEYRAAQETRRPRFAFSDVRAARERGHGLFCEIVALIIGTYYRHDLPEHNRARTALLAPIMEQNEAIRTYLRRRRPVVDIDPDTGEPDPDAPDSDEPDGEPDGEPLASLDGEAGDNATQVN